MRKITENAKHTQWFQCRGVASLDKVPYESMLQSNPSSVIFDDASELIYSIYHIKTEAVDTKKIDDFLNWYGLFRVAYV